MLSLSATSQQPLRLSSVTLSSQTALPRPGMLRASPVYSKEIKKRSISFRRNLLKSNDGLNLAR